MPSTTEPPYYILVSRSSLQNSTSGSTSNSLTHPIIEYHYADDSSLSLVPRYPDEDILVLIHIPSSDGSATANIRSLSKHLAVTGLKISDAPGAGADEDNPNRNDKMYVLEVTSTNEDDSLESSQAYSQNPQNTLARFKQRNLVLRHILEYPFASQDDGRHIPLPDMRPPSSG